MKDPIFCCFCEHSLFHTFKVLLLFRSRLQAPTPLSTRGLLIAYTIDLGSNIRESQSSVKICTRRCSFNIDLFCCFVLVKTTERDGSQSKDEKDHKEAGTSSHFERLCDVRPEPNSGIQRGLQHDRSKP